MRTVREIKERLKIYSSSPKSTDILNNIKANEIERQPSFESMLCADDELIYAARKDIQVIVSFQVEKDGVGQRGVNMQEIMKYGHSWQKIYSMFLHMGCIFLSHCEGIRKCSLEVVQVKDEPCMLTCSAFPCAPA